MNEHHHDHHDYLDHHDTGNAHHAHRSEPSANEEKLGTIEAKEGGRGAIKVYQTEIL